MPVAHSNGYKIAYEVSGVGPPLLLHPGMFQDGGHWAHSGYTETLAETHMVIAVDPLGHGASDAPHQTGAYALERRAASVIAVMDDLGIDRAAFWGYSLGALTGYAVAVEAPERLSCLIAGAFDPVGGFRSAVDHAIQTLGLPDDVDAFTIMRQGAYADPYQAALIDAGDPVAFRANYEAFSREPGLHAEIAASGVPILMYVGTDDPWHEPMRTFAADTGSAYFSLQGADHKAGWDRSAEVLPHARAFLAGHNAD